MPRFRIIRHLVGASVGGGGGGGGSSPVTYDTRFGTATDSDGWITFAPTGRYVWQGAGGNDANDGLSYANRKLTPSAAASVYMNGSHTPGDILLLGNGAALVDDGVTGIFEKDGASLTRPNVVQGYSQADPFNTALYGRLLGADQPQVSCNYLPSARQSSSFSAGGSSNFSAVQGITFISTSTAAGASAIGGSVRRQGQCFQNTHWHGMGLIFDIDETATTANWRSDFHVSKSSGYGQVNLVNGNTNWIYISGTTGFYGQDLVTIHNGWSLTTTRSNTNYATGAASYLGHGIYFSATNSGAHFDRIVGVDCAQDPFSFRGAHAATCLVSLDNPVPGSMGGFSNPTYIDEAPNGVLVTWDDCLFMGGDDINAGLPLGYGPGADNTVSGSHLRNVAMFDNPKYGGPNNYAFSSGVSRLGNSAGTATEIDVHMLFDKIRSRNYAPILEAPAGTYPAKYFGVYSDGKFDGLGTSSNPNTVLGGDVVTWSGPGASYKTRDQVVTDMLNGMGVTPGASYTARKAQLVNYMLEYPHLKWAEAMMSIGLPAMGLSLTTISSVSPPSVSGLTSPRSVY